MTILEPGYQVVLEGGEDGKKLQLVMIVLNETRIVDGVETRVVEEKETEGGSLVEIRNFKKLLCNVHGEGCDVQGIVLSHARGKN